MTEKKEDISLAALNRGFVVAITIEAKAGQGDAVAEILEGLVAPSMAEPGVKVFLPYRSAADPALFFLYELYSDEASWAAHQETAHFNRDNAKLLPLVARRERIPVVPYIAAEDRLA